MATPSPSSKSDANKWLTVTIPLLLSLASQTAFSSILFKSGVYKNHSLGFEPVPITLIISALKEL